MPEGKEKTKVGKILQTIGKFIPEALDIAGDITDVEVLNNIADKIRGNVEIDERTKLLLLEQLSIAADLEKARLADVASARKMQEAALNQEDKFSKRFIYFFASIWSLVGAATVMLPMFIEIPEANIRLVDTTFGFLLGTVLASMFNYFFGSSKGSADKNLTIDKLKSLIK